MTHLTSRIAVRVSLKLVVFILLHISSAMIVAAQNAETREPVLLPDSVMEQVVRRILVWEFKPRTNPKTILLAEKGIKKTWLPEIPGINFRLLSETEVVDKGNVYFFTEVFTEFEKNVRNKYEIGFAFGNLECPSKGVFWRFRIAKGHVRLWVRPGSVGWGCGAE